MSRPLRIEFPGAVYHVTARGDRSEPIFEDDDDHTAFLAVLAQALSRFDAQGLALLPDGQPLPPGSIHPQAQPVAHDASHG